MKKLVAVCLLLLFIGTAVIFLVRKYSSHDLKELDISPKDVSSVSSDSVPYTIDTVVSKVSVPWAITFTSQQRMLFTERKGNLRVVENGVLAESPLLTFPEISTSGEEGLMGLTIDPNYAINSYLYTAYAYPKGNGLVVKVVRLKDQGATALVDKVLLDDIPAARFHAGTRLAFGLDGALYITTGDALNKTIAQDKNSLGGKILRINSDGSIPRDNPFPGSPIFSFGHRNPQGITWHPETKQLYATEHGPSIIDGPAGGDEINRIVAGGNYGWPIVSHEKNREGLISPLLIYTPAVAPASALIYSGKIFPQFKHTLFFGGLAGKGLYRVYIDKENPNTLSKVDKLTDISFGRIREVVEGPDGYIYFSTSNRDGRGKPDATDDRIMRLIPAK